eukprot:tig00000219_g19523.t1
MTAFSAQTISLIGSNLSRSADEGGASDLKRRESPAPIEPPPPPPPPLLFRTSAWALTCAPAHALPAAQGPAADAYPAHPSSTPCETWSPLASAGCVPGLELAGRQQRRGAQKKREGRGPARVLELGGKATPILNCEWRRPAAAAARVPARDVVRLLWDEPIEGSGGEYTPETCPRAWLFLKKCGGGARKTHDTLRAAIPALARVHVETGGLATEALECCHERNDCLHTCTSFLMSVQHSCKWDYPCTYRPREAMRDVHHFCDDPR